MIVTNPDPYLLPAYRLSPFNTSDISNNARLKNDGTAIDNYFSKRFISRKYIYTQNGRAALNIALKYYKLDSSDVVTIYTTTGNQYISSCVTSEIEKYCKWSWKIEANTKVILANHEFGYPYQELLELKELGYPIIEDCAYAFMSENEKQNIGKVGDFTVYSFPKFFPLQVGGLLTYNENISLDDDSFKSDGEILDYTKRVLSNYIDEIDLFTQQRIANYKWLRNELSVIGCRERLPLGKGVIPGVYLFTVPIKIDLTVMKDFLWNWGIQCSVFYGEQTFFIPVHQRLQEDDLTYITEMIKDFLRKQHD